MQNRDLSELIEYVARRYPTGVGVGNYAFCHEDLPPQATDHGDGLFCRQQFHWRAGMSYQLPETTPAGLGGLQAGQFIGQALADPEYNSMF